MLNNNSKTLRNWFLYALLVVIIHIALLTYFHIFVFLKKESKFELHLANINELSSEVIKDNLAKKQQVEISFGTIALKQEIKEERKEEKKNNKESSSSTQNIYKASILKQTPIKYPRSAVIKGLEGTTVLHIFINSKGEAEKVEIFQGSGYKILDNNSKKIVKTWIFNPVKNKEQGAWVSLNIDYKLR